MSVLLLLTAMVCELLPSPLEMTSERVDKLLSTRRECVVVSVVVSVSSS